MRRIVYAALGFSAACGLSLYLNSWFARLIGIGAVFLLSALAERKPGVLRRIFVAFIGCTLGFIWFHAYTQRYLKPVETLDGEITQCTIRASDFSRETAYGTAVDGVVSLNGNDYRITVYLKETESFVPGDTISGRFRLRITTDAGDNPSSYYHGRGVFLLAYQTESYARSVTPQTWKDIPANLRYRIKQILQEYVPGDSVPFAKALLLGDTSDLSYQTDTDLKVSGIRHVVAVSGLHISIFFAIISAVTFRKRFLTALFGVPLLILFAAVAGFTPSVTRACIMCALMLAAQLLNREYDGASALSVAVLTMLVCNPYCFSSVSFQLSVASVAGILLFTPGILNAMIARLAEKKGKRYSFLRKLAAAVSVTVGAQVFTIPLCAWYFGMVSLVGVVTNLLVLWVISLIFCMLTVICLLALISSTLARMIGMVAAFLIRYVLLAAKIMASFPLAAVYMVSPYITAWLIFLYGLLILFLVSGKRIPKTFFCCAILSLCIALLASWLEPKTSDVRISVLDVGQGQCVLIQSKGRTYVVDCGGDSDRRTADIAAEALMSQGYSRIDGLILTHTDKDHAGGAEYFLSRIHTDFLILPDTHAAISVPDNTRTVIAERDLHITDGDSEISVFVPVYHGSDNEMSLCVLFQAKKCGILITGDRNAFGERSLLRHAEIPDVDVLIAGHHGAKSSTCEELLAAVKPEIVCISVGKDNPYGHPNSELLERLSDFGCAVYRTDQQGTITIRR